MKKKQESFRLIALRHNGKTHEHVIRNGARTVRVSVLMKGGFGVITYEWNGKHMTVSGLPVFESAPPSISA